jgi:hypothetical protein
MRNDRNVQRCPRDGVTVSLTIEREQASADARSANRAGAVRGGHRLDGVVIGANLLRV